MKEKLSVLLGVFELLAVIWITFFLIFFFAGSVAFAVVKALKFFGLTDV
jgi:hypothetical protein